MGLCSFSMMNRLNEPEALKPPNQLHVPNIDRGILIPISDEPKIPADARQAKPKQQGLEPREEEPKRPEPVEPHEEIHEVKTLSNKTANVRYRLGPDAEKKLPVLRSRPAPVPEAAKQDVVKPKPVVESNDSATNIKKGSPLGLDSQKLAEPPPPNPEDSPKKEKQGIELLEQIAEVQQEQKKMIEDIQKKINQEIALHKEGHENQSNKSIGVEQSGTKNKPLDGSVQMNGNKSDAIVPETNPNAITDRKPVEFKGPLKVLNRRPIKKPDEVAQKVVERHSESKDVSPAGADAIASMVNAAQHQKASNGSHPSSNVGNAEPVTKVVPAEQPELLSEIAKKERPAILEDMNKSLKDEKPVDIKPGPEVKPEVKKVIVPLVVKMNPANASKKESNRRV